MKIGITGAEGTIGSVLRKGLSNKYKITSPTRRGMFTKGISFLLVNLSTKKPENIKVKIEIVE